MNTIFKSEVCPAIPEYNYSSNKSDEDDDVIGSSVVYLNQYTHNSVENYTLQDAVLCKDSFVNKIENRSDINYEIDESVTHSCHIRKSYTSVINNFNYDDIDELDLVPGKLKANKSRIKKIYKRIVTYCKGKIIKKKKIVKKTDEKIHHSFDDININIEINRYSTINKEDDDCKRSDIIYRDDASLQFFVNDDITNDSSYNLENKNKKKATKYKFKKYVLKIFKRQL